VVHPLTDTFRRAELFRDLDDVALKALVRCSIEKRLNRGEILFVASEKAEGLYLIAEGSVARFAPVWTVANRSFTSSTP